jgi:hypothetical protein
VAYDSAIGIPGASPPTQPAVTQIRTIQTIDGNGRTIETQCVCIVDEDANEVTLMSETTGQRILEALHDISRVLKKGFGLPTI